MPETYVYPHGLFQVRYPSEWEVIEQSQRDEILVAFEAPAETPTPARALINVFKVGSSTSDEGLQALADAYLRNFLQDLYDVVVRTPLERDGNALVTTIRTPHDDPEQQTHLEIWLRAEGALFAVVITESTEAHWTEAAPTLRALARSLTLRPEQAGRLATPIAGVDRSVETLRLVNARSYRAQTGALYFVGEVEHIGQQPQQDVLVTISLLSSDGGVVAHETWPLAVPVIHPGERIPLLAIFEPAPAEWSSYETSVVAHPADEASSRRADGLAVTETGAETSPFGAYRIKGVVVNTGDRPAASLTVIGALYGTGGQVLAVEVLHPAQDTLASDERLTFEVRFPATAEGEIEDHRILVSGLHPVEQEED